MRPVVRAECGTMQGILAHQRAGEHWCGWCLHAEQVARVSAERLAPPPVPLLPAAEGTWFAPITPDRAAANAALLLRELDAYEQDGGYEARRLRRVA